VVSLHIKVSGTDHLVTDGDVAIIGRDPASTIPVEADGVSRQHARVRLVDGTWLLEDAGSRFGVFHNGEKVQQVVVAGPTTVRLGDPDNGLEVTLTPAEAVKPGRPRPMSVPVETGGPDNLTVGTLRNARSVYATSAVVRIGRAPDNDVVLDDLVVSRYHAELRGTPEAGFELTDLGSFNGTFVNGVLADRARLSEGDVVSVGHHRLRLAAGALEEYVETGDVFLEVHDLSVTTPSGQKILDGVSFALPERSLLAVVGPSGAGKSTLLNALTGFRPAHGGSVLYDGRDLYRSYADLRQRIGYVPQDDILHLELTARQALDYAAQLRFPPDVTAEQRRARVDEVLGELGLSHRADLPISRMSGGQRKRCSVATELLTKPSLLFLDEPTSGLDPGYERSLTKLLRDLADGGRTVIVVTHSVQSLDLCDRMIFLAPGGRTAFFGPPDEVSEYFDRPTYADVFETLEVSRDADWSGQFRDHPAYQRYVATPLSAAPHTTEGVERDLAQPIKRQGWWRQFSTLVRRYLAVIRSDRKLLLALILQAPILGLIMMVALPPDELAPLAEGELTRFSQATAVLIVLIVGVTGLGLAASVREIVKEAAVFRRERSVGLSITAYVASKAVVIGAIVTVQCTILVLMAVLPQGSDWGAAVLPSGPLEFVVGFVLAGLAGMSLGLLISAVSTNVDRAISLLPLLLIVQLVLSGAFQNVNETPVMREVSYLASGYWGYSAAASTIDLSQLQALNDCLNEDTKINSSEDVTNLLECALVERASDEGETVSQLEAALIQFGLPGDQAATLAAEAQAARASGDPFETESNPPALRFWDQTPADWLTNAGVLVAMVLAGLLGAVYALKRKDGQSD
jgi:ABC-type multidrug transport system ATPase subunit/pSer/pThr/pTyr-binding forkhead associated (FHA) protein